jgi:hypothetical protein
LEETGMAYVGEFLPASINSDLMLTFIDSGKPVPFFLISDHKDNWQPYHPETDCPCGCREITEYHKGVKERCEACLRRDSVGLEEGSGVVQGGYIQSMLKFLLEQHCTCGGAK